MKKSSHRNKRSGKYIKAASIAAAAFFSFPALSAAQSNIVHGSAFGTNAQQAVFSSLKDGFGSLTIGDPATTGVVLSNKVSGSIGIENSFDRFTITATGGRLTSATNAVAPALSVSGGTNLSVSGGSFIGRGGLGSIILPPIPGEGSQIILSTNATEAAALQGVQQAVIRGSRFEGTAYAPESNQIIGTDGMTLLNSAAAFADQGTNTSVLIGGNGQPVYAQNDDAVSVGGRGLFAADGSSVTITNGTFRGGRGSNTSAGAGKTAYSVGGDGARLEQASITVLGGTFEGGASGTADDSTAGHGLYATNSTVNLFGGQFTGGNAGTATTSTSGSGLLAVSSTIQIDGTNTVLTGGNGAAGFTAENSDITVNGGTFRGGALDSGTYYGLVSISDTGKTASVALNGGTFSSISFRGQGTQLLTAGTNLVVEDYLVVDDGTLAVVDLSSTNAFNNVFVRDGSLVFSNAFTMSAGSALSLLTPASRADFQDLEVRNGAELYVGQGLVEASGRIGIAPGAAVNIELASNSVSKIMADTVTFGSNSTLNINALTARFGAGTNSLNLINTTSGIFVANAGGTNAATTAGFNENVNVVDFTDWLTIFNGATITGGNRLDLSFITATWGSAWDSGTSGQQLADELETLDDGTMGAVISTMNQATFKAAIEETYLSTFNTFGTALQGLQAAVGQSVSRGTEFRENLRLPKGASGPDEAASDWRFWGKFYSQLYQHDATAAAAAYDTTLLGGSFGMDRSFGSLLVGISGGSGHYRIERDPDGRQNMDAAHGALYSTFGKGRSYLDAGLAYGYNSVDSHTASPFVLDGKFDTHLLMGYVGGGFGLEVPEAGLVVTPEAGAQYALYRQEGYDETGTAATPRSFDDFDADSLRTSLGLNMAMQNTKAFETFAFKLEGRYHWLHEFNPEPGNQSFRLIGGNNAYLVSYPPLDEDVIRLGIGLSCYNTLKNSPKNIMLRLDFDELIGKDFNSHNFSAKAIFAF